MNDVYTYYSGQPQDDSTIKKILEYKFVLRLDKREVCKLRINFLINVLYQQ